MNCSRHTRRAAARAGIGSIGLAAALLGSGCSRVNLNCAWQATAIVVDGQTEEWSSPWYSMADDRIALSVTNDADFLYLGLAPSGAGVQAQMMQGGITVWLDPAGGKSRDFGIRYPLGRGGHPGPPDSSRGGRPPDSEAMRRAMESGPKELEILTEGGKARRRVALSDAGGIEARAGFSEEQFAFEIKIPLRSDPQHPFSAGLVAGQPLGLGVEIAAARGGGRTGQPGDQGGPGGGGSGPPSSPPDGGGGGPPGGDGGGPRGGGMPPAGGGPGGRHGGSSGAIRVWIRVVPAEGHTAL
jgi:hypothetical protein